MKYSLGILGVIPILFLGACNTIKAPQKIFSHNPFSFSDEKEDSQEETESEPQICPYEPNAEDGPPYVDRDVTRIPNAIPKLEPISKFGNPPTYEALGTRYHVMSHSKGYSAEGVASWYGRKFHGQRTSSGEPYDMYAMTAAHRSLPIPTYAKVKNLENGKEVIVKINDRGPFAKDRLIDLSYAAAKKLGIHAAGTGKVMIAAIDPVEWHKMNNKKESKKSDREHIAQKTSKNTPKTAAKEKTTETAKPIVLAENNTNKAKTEAKAKPEAKTKTKTESKTKSKAKTQSQSTVSTVAANDKNKQIFIQLGSFNQKDNANALAKKANTLIAALESKSVHVVTDKKADKNLYKVRIGPLKNEMEAKKLQKKVLALNGIDSTKLIYE